MKKLMMLVVATIGLAALVAQGEEQELRPWLVADYNRDGKIDAVDYIRAATNESFTIWINDDDDADGAEHDEGKGDTNNDLHDVPSGKDNDKDCADDKVNGRCDLLDFFPVLVEVPEGESWNGFVWKLRGKSVNVVFVGLDAEHAGDFHTKAMSAFGSDTPLYEAPVTNLADGVELPKNFLQDGKGVFLIEGAALAEGNGLMLCGEREGGDPVEVTLDLRVKNVEDLYGWMNLREKGTGKREEGTGDDRPAPVREDADGTVKDNRHFVLVHGYNTNHDEARGNAAEFYKKLYQSGSDAMFTAVEWKGDQSQFNIELLGITFSPNYFVNVENAFAAARPFAAACNKLPGEKIVVGHSLGNMLISSAIRDYGLDYTKYVMLNAAVAREAYDASVYDDDMVSVLWTDDDEEGGDSLTNHLDRASRWYRNFAGHEYDPYEYRRKLAWRGRFANLPRTVNYYSPTDNLLANPANPDLDDFNEEDAGNKVKVQELLGKTMKLGGFWALSEKLKGRPTLIDTINYVLTNKFEMAESDAYKCEGGWGENDSYVEGIPFSPTNTHFTPFLDPRMKTIGMLDILPAETERLRAQHLADAIPAESFAAGANPVATLENVNEESFIGENPDWPVFEGDETKTNEWKHSTFREVAFYHTSAFYTSIAAVGKPRIIIDTDLGSSMDDLFAVDLAARMHKAGKLDLMAVMMDRPDYSDDAAYRGEFLTFADRYLASLGLGDLPIGKAEGHSKEGHTVFNPYWTLIYSNNLTGVGLLLPTNRTPDQINNSLTNAVVLYRRLLKDSPDTSVVICSTGFLTNLEALMKSGADEEGDGSINSTGLQLIAAKVKELRIMGGCFDYTVAPDGAHGAEYNFAGDPTAAKKVVEEWPTPVILSPWEVGLKLEYKPDDVLKDFPAGAFDPAIRSAYTYWPEPLGDGDKNRLWDPATVLPLTEGEMLVPLSSNGVITVDETTGKTTFTPDPSSNRCYQVASNMNANAVMNRLRAIYRTGNPSLPDAVRCIKDAGVDYNGHDLTFKVPKFSLGAYSPDDVRMAFAFGDKSYAPDEVTYDPVLEVFSVHFTVPKEDATAGNFYNGALTITLDNEKLGSNVVKVVPTQIVQGAIDSDNSEVWFYETNLEAPTNYVPAKVGKGDMPERRTATVQTTFTFEAATPETDEPPDGEAQAAVRIVEDAERGGYKFQYYAFVANTNGYCYRKWHDFNVGNETEVRPVVGNPYIVQMEGLYLEDSRREINTLAISVKDGYNDIFHKQFVGNLVNADGGIGGTTRLNSVEFTGDGVIETLDGVYSVNRVNANLARVDGVEYPNVAAAVAAANGKDVWLLHAASWKPTAADLGQSVKFLNKNSLHLDLSDLPLGTRGVWTDVNGNNGTLTLVEGLPVGVCSWTWHSSMSNVLAQMAADGRYNGMQLALAPWLGIDSMSLYFGDQEGKEVWDFIKDKIRSGELNVMSTMINFPKEDYSTLHSISNTQGYMYGVATNAPDQAEQWASNLFYTAEAAKLTKELGVKTLTTEAGFICIDEPLMYQRIAEICATCQVYGVDFLIESGPQHSQDMTNLLTRLNAAGITNVGVNFDPGDTALFGSEDPVESYKAMKPWIRMIHAKDCKSDRAAWNVDCVWGDGSVSGLDFGGSRTFLNAVKEDFTNGINILYERLSGDATLTVKRQREITLAMDRIFAALEEPEGTVSNRWAVGAPGKAVLAYTNGTTLVVEGRGAMKDFTEEDLAPWRTDISAVDFGAQVTAIGANAFAGCSALTTLVMRGNPPAIGEGNDFAGKTIIVREDAKAKFEADDGWKNLTYSEAMKVGYDYANVKTLAPFLHEVRYTKDYVCATDSVLSENPSTAAAFACSAVRKGNFLGRNFDYVLNDVPTFVVRMDAAPGRLASVGVSQQWGIREDGVTNGQYTASYDLVPMMMLDGINECGVAVEDNVVHIGDCGELTGTNPGAPDLNISYVLRYVLDHATNAAHGVELIKSRNLVGDIGGHFYLHYMIADAKETYVVEVVTNTVVARHMDIMTNFNLNWDNGNRCAISDANSNGWAAVDYPAPWSNDVEVATIDSRYAPSSAGVERFLILRDHYKACEETMDGMTNLMRYVQYTKQAVEGCDPIWLSEIAASERPLAALYAMYKDKDPALMAALEKMNEDTRRVFADKEAYRKQNTGEWQTVHNTTYDIEKRMFRIAVQEDYEHTFDIYLADSEPLAPGHSSKPFNSVELARAAIDSGAVSFAPASAVEEVLKDSAILTVEGYKAMFAPVIYPSGDKYRVMYVLTENATNALEQSVHTIVTNLNLVALAAAPEKGVDLSLKGGLPGFYYTLFKSEDVTNVTDVGSHDKANSDRLCDKTGTVTFEKVTKPSDAAGFFTVRASPEQVFTGEADIAGAIVVISPILIIRVE